MRFINLLGITISSWMLASAPVQAQLLPLETLEKEAICYSIDRAARNPEKIMRLQVLRRAYRFPTAVSQLTPLQWLTMNHTLVEAIPDRIANLQDLQVLELRGNKLKALPPAVGQLKNLRRLDASKNYLTALPSFETMPQLEWLLLEKNERLDTLPESVFTRTQLQRLNVSRTRLAYLPPSVAQLQALTELDVSKNNNCPKILGNCNNCNNSVLEAIPFNNR